MFFGKRGDNIIVASPHLDMMSIGRNLFFLKSANVLKTTPGTVFLAPVNDFLVKW